MRRIYCQGRGCLSDRWFDPHGTDRQAADYPEVGNATQFVLEVPSQGKRTAPSSSKT